MRVGKGGAHAAEVPKLIAIMSVVAVCLAGTLASAVYFGRDGVAKLFNPNPNVTAVVDESMLGAALSIPGYGLLMTLAGACRGASRQRLVAVGTVAGYAIGVPLAWYLGYHKGWAQAHDHAHTNSSSTNASAGTDSAPLLGVWYGNAIALGWAAAWAVVATGKINWRTLNAVGSSVSASAGGGAGADGDGSSSGRGRGGSAGSVSGANFMVEGEKLLLSVNQYEDEEDALLLPPPRNPTNPNPNPKVRLSINHYEDDEDP
jgi:hypothetical protein